MVNNNQLTALPESIGQLIQLQELWVYNNQLIALPDSIGQLTRLQELWVFHNLIRTLPGTIGNLISLRRLAICNNSSLSELPITLGNVPGLTHIDLEGTNIPSEIRDTILRQCQQQRQAHGKASLPQLLDLWKGYAKSHDDLSHVLSYNDTELGHINEWLVRLSNAKDFKYGQSTLTEKVCKILSCLKNNEEFKNWFLGQIAINNTACGDRAAMAFIETYTYFLLHNLPEDSSIEDRLKVVRQCARTLLFMEVLSDSISKHEQLTKNKERESVEIFLYYSIKLKERLGLVSAIESMFYGTIGKRDWINEKEIVKQVTDKYVDVMERLDMLHHLALEDEEYENEEKEVKSRYDFHLETLDDNRTALTDQQYTNESNSMQQNRETELAQLRRTWLLKQLERIDNLEKRPSKKARI